MKSLIKNDDAISVVVGAILILAVLVTFMSVVTSSWVPVYESDAESAHSDDTNKTFMDIHKQIELADEFARSATIDMGTDQMSLIKGLNSVGYLEVNESGGAMFLTSNVTRQSEAWGEGFDIVGLDTNDTEPFTNLSFEFTQLDYYKDDNNNTDNMLNTNFMIKMWTTELSRWITLYPTDMNSSGWWCNKMGIFVSYYANPQVETWVGESSNLTCDIITVVHSNIHINLLTNDSIMILTKPEILTINNHTYNASNASNNIAPLKDVIQHYMRLPGDGTGGTYELDYVQYDGILEANQHITYETIDEGSSMVVSEGGMITTILDDFKVGGGTLKLQSDYNFMVDQSYIYDSGAVILRQEDGAVFKVDPPIVATNNSGNLTLTLKTTVMEGEYQSSGNDIETLYTALDGPVYEVTGVTNNITIMKNTTSEYYELWHSYFSELGDIVNTTSANCSVINGTNQVGVNIFSTTPDITLTVQKKVITIA